VPTEATSEFDLGPLSWVQGEIDQALTRGLESLAAFKASPKDAIALKHARTHVHQAAGAIQMVGLDAVVAFTDEIERQLTLLEETPPQDVAAAVAVVDRACRKLRIFLDELTNGAPPVPLKLFPEYEAMQALRGIKATAPTDLFYPDLSARAPKIAPREALPASRLASQIVKQRRVYQRGLLSWLRSDAEGLAQMREAIAGIEDVTTHANLRAFWWTVGALFESLAANGLDPSFGVKQLAARIDLQIRRVVGGSAKVADRLRREALYYVAISAPTGPQVQAVQRTFHLAGLIPSADVLNADLVRIEPLLREAREQLAGAKDAWLKFASGRAENLPKLKQTLTSVHTKAAEIHNGALMKLTAALVERLDKMPSAGVSEPVAMEYATALLLAESAFENYTNLASDFPQQVDAMVARLDAARAGRASSAAGAPALDEMSKRAQERMLLAQVGREIQANLRHMEQVLDAFFRDNGKRNDLAGLAKDSQQIRGALSMLGLNDASRLLASCQEQIESYVNSETPVDNDDLEMLAESLSGLGFYIEAVEQQRPDRDRLIAPLLARRTGEMPPAVADDDAESVETAVDALRAQLPRLLDEVKSAPSQDAARQGLKNKLETLRDDAELIGDATLAQQAEAALTELDAGGAAELAKAVDAIADTTAAAPEISAETQRLLETDATQFDAELLEIFLTEASEVLDAIAASRTALAANPSDREALGTARRGFHTLKGSGRMVGLADLGDLAWEVEKAHNRLLDEDRPVTAAVVTMIGVAESEFRNWVEALQRTRRVTLDPAQLNAAVDAVMTELPSTGAPPPASPPPLPPRLAEVPAIRDTIEPADAIGTHAPADDFIELPELGVPPTVTPQVVVRDIAPPSELPHPIPSLKLVADNSHVTPGIGASGLEVLHPASGFAGDDVDASFDKDLASRFERDTTDITLLPIDEAPVEAFDFDEAANAGFDDARVVPLTPPAAPAAAPAGELHETPPPPATDDSRPTQGVDEFADLQDPPDLRLPLDPGGAGHDSATGDHDIVVGGVTLSSTLFRILTDEADEHVATLQHELALMQSDPARVPSPTMVRASHTLCGIHRTGGFPIVAITAKALEQALLGIAEREAPMPSGAQPVIARAVACLADLVARIKARAAFAAGDQREAVETTTELDMLRQDSMMTGTDAESHAAEVAARDDEAPLDVPNDEVASAAEIAAPPKTEPLPPSASSSSFSSLAPSPVSIAPPTVLPSSPPLVSSGSPPATIVHVEPTPHATPAAVAPDPVAARIEPVRSSLANVRDVIEGDVLPIFLEEAADLFPQAGNELRAWRRDPATDGAQALRRTLHTFKGSARMAGAMRLGELAHLMETRLEGEGPVDTSPALFEALDTDLDHMAYVLDKLRVGDSNTALPWIDGDAPSASADDDAGRDTADSSAQAAERAVVVPIGALQSAAPVQPMPPRAEALEPEAGARAMLRVRADTVDRLVNEAGEVAIARARVEGELRTLKANLLELTNSVIRLRSQVREIEIQAESQIQSRMSAMQEAHEGFDPLEFDRYTRFQELTRSLAEGVNDVSTVQQSLLKNLDDADAALVAQARMSREVSQQLFAIRTVPFGSVSERLYRILRATARELDKRANLDIHGAQVELDRSVLEKLIGPLEHLLRNALDHGIEARAARTAAGKSETGELALTVRQVGNEVVIELTDDGAGIDLAKVAGRAKALGLVAADATPTDAQLIECIFQPGFSTASKVTQISGRGIGMDVVRTDINALGGRVDVGTRQGLGTAFTIYLPLTLAVAQAVLVRAGGRLWALPAPMVEQVQQVKSEALVNLYVNRKVTWQNRDYPFHYLPRLLGDASHNPESLRYNPVMLLKSGQSHAAIHVDEMIGNQEIVVKNIGPQLARVSGISGATVLGTGEIVLIINPVQLAQRADIDAAAAPVPGAVAEVRPHVAAGPSLVLVVDDSLTVRKITSRLLQREGFAVVTAKDGIDALQAIGEQVPDVILVDIEMPRMDGFEFTKTLKGDARNARIPIIMITSRTAEKHRNRARELGVDVYLGKPYQEEELLRNIRGMLAAPVLH
jgi:chemosensory pili system protein ChpA (sensor histidine kinase/response regulator)